MQKFKAIILLVVLGIFISKIAVADDMEVLTEKQLKCVDVRMSKWQKQRDKEINSRCEKLAKKGEECRISVGVEELLKEDALKAITAKCKKKSKV